MPFNLCGIADAIDYELGNDPGFVPKMRFFRHKFPTTAWMIMIFEIEVEPKKAHQLILVAKFNE